MTNFCSESRSPDQDPNRALPNTNQQRQALDRDNKEKYASTEQVQHVCSTKAAFCILYYLDLPYEFIQIQICCYRINTVFLWQTLFIYLWFIYQRSRYLRPFSVER